MTKAVWVETTIADLAGIFDGPHATPKKINVGPVFLSISSLDNGRLNLARSAHLSEADFVRWTRRVEPMAGDVVFSYETRLGEAALIPENLRCCLGRRMGLLRADRTKVDPRFLLYAFLGPQFQAELRKRTVSGATVDRILLTELGSFPIRVPDLLEQRSIAHILGALDDKIELNERMNETLDEMARVLFKSWFVDFDPVHAKAEGRQPYGMDAATAALFPDSFEDSELGPIPSGWEIVTLSDVAQVMSGKRPGDRQAVPSEGMDIPLFGGAGPIAYVGEPLYSTPMVLTGRVGTLGVVHRVTFPVWPSDNTLVIVPKRSGRLSWLFNVVRRFDLANLNRGSTQPLLTQTDLKSQLVIRPLESLIDAFLRMADPMNALIDMNSVESRTLAELRDALLPKLISGDLRVGPAIENEAGK
jgi:type I restriction enzyme, S subunit